MPKAKIETVEFEVFNRRMQAAGFDVRDLMGRAKFNGYKRWLRRKGYVESHTTPKMQEQFAEYKDDPEGMVLEPAYLDFWHELIAWKKKVGRKRMFLIDESIIPEQIRISEEQREAMFMALAMSTGKTVEFLKKEFPSAVNDLIARVEARHEGYTKMVAAVFKVYGGPVRIEVKALGF